MKLNTHRAGVSHFPWEGIENQWRYPVSTLTTTENTDTVCYGLEDMEAVSVVVFEFLVFF